MINLSSGEDKTVSKKKTNYFNFNPNPGVQTEFRGQAPGRQRPPEHFGSQTPTQNFSFSSV